VLTLIDLHQQANSRVTARITQVPINCDPAGGDIYKVGSKKEGNAWINLYSLAKPALNRLAGAAAINWDIPACRAIDEERDLRGSLCRIVYRAVGEIRGASGEIRRVSGEKELDLRIIEDEEYLNNTKKARDKADSKGLVEGLAAADWARLKTDENLIQWRKNMRARAETGAKLRVLREALGIGMQFTAEQLSHPFVVLSVELKNPARAAVMSVPEVQVVSDGLEADPLAPIEDEPAYMEGEFADTDEEEAPANEETPPEEEPAPEEARPAGQIDWPENKGRYMAAKFPGTCFSCRTQISKDDLIWYNVDAPKDKQVWHEDCRRAWESAPDGEDQ
jgi:hypothetical protein